MLLVWRKETQLNSQWKLLSSHTHFNHTDSIHFRHSGWVHLPVSIDRWGKGGEESGSMGKGSMQATLDSLITSLKSHLVQSCWTLHHAQRPPCMAMGLVKEQCGPPAKKWDLCQKKRGRQRRLPCCMRAPTPNQKLFSRVKLFSTTSESGLQGWGLYHSQGLNL